MSTAPTPQPDDSVQYIKLPDGSYGKFAATASDAEIRGHIEKDFPDAYKNADPQNIDAVSSNVARELTTGVGTGIIKGAGNTVHGVGTLLNKIPKVGKYLAPQEGLDALENMTRPINLPQKVGYYGEQAGEFLVPGAGEEKAGLMAAKYLPKLGKAAPIIGRLAAATADNAVINKVQGGSATEGAIGGLGGGIIGEGGRAVAPAIAESALGITKKMRGYGKTPGAAVLDEVRGMRPETILKNATSKTNALTQEMEAMAAAHPGMIDMRPAIGAVDSAKAKAAGQNYAIGALDDVKDQLTKRVGSGIPIAADQSASNALALKRGLRSNFVTNWNPEVHAAVGDTAKKASRAIDVNLDKAIGPKFGDINQRVSSLIPVAERAESVSRGAPISQKIIHRVGAHTGALAGAATGGVIGYQNEGLPGMVKLGGIGLVAPELIASPTGQMVAARALRSGIPIKAAVGAGQQVIHGSRKKKTDDEDSE